MKKGRHRRYEKARELKQQLKQPEVAINQDDEALDACPECAGISHKEWCQFSKN